MPDLNRIYVGEKVALRLKQLKGNTGLTPNLLCRIGLCLSLEEPGIPDPDLYADETAREFNRYTLTGQWDEFFFALLRERMIQDGLDVEEKLEEQFLAHVSRGVLNLYSRIDNLEDIADIVQKARRKADIEKASTAAATEEAETE
jgi:DNA sulfur modification protein DndE